MRTKFYFFIGVWMLAVACDMGSSVKDPENDLATKELNSFLVKVVSSLCGNAILEIQDDAYYKYGVDWENAAGVRYQHVFATTFSCYADVGTGETIRIQLLEKPEAEDCARCEAYLETPDKRYFVKVLKN